MNISFVLTGLVIVLFVASLISYAVEKELLFKIFIIPTIGIGLFTIFFVMRGMNTL